MGHVADRIDMNQKPHAGDHQQHDQRELVERKGKVGVENSGLNPWPEGFDIRQRQRRKARRDIQDEQKRRGGKEQRDRRNDRVRQFSAQQPVQQKAGEGQQRNQPEMQCGRAGHSFIRSIESTFRVFRVRKIAMMMASPTAASAAATTITKNTNIWPLTSRH